MSKRIGTAIRCEEQRTSYLNQEYAKLIGVLQQHDIDAGDPCEYLPSQACRMGPWTFFCLWKWRGHKLKREIDRRKRPMLRWLNTAHWQRYWNKSISSRWFPDENEEKERRPFNFSLQASGEINMTVNNWLNVSCCLPHRSITMNCSLPIDIALKALFDAETHFRWGFADRSRQRDVSGMPIEHLRGCVD